MRHLHIVSLIVLASTLAGCGGGGGGVASTPAPASVAPQIVGTSYVVQKQLPPAPAWTTGTYQGIAVVRNNLNGDVAQAPTGTVSLAVDTAAKTYALTVSAGTVAVASAPFSTEYVTAGSSPLNPYIGTTVKMVKQWSDGVARPAEDVIQDVTAGGYHSPETRLAGQKVLSSYLAVSSSPGRHVSLGYWSLSEAPLNPDGTRGTTSAWSEGQFVFGDRTTPGDIPTSGTAKYLLESPEAEAEGEALVSLVAFDADFAARSIAAKYSVSAEAGLYPNGIISYPGDESPPDPATRIGTIALATNATGTAPFTSAGSFDIALAGTAMVHVDRIDNTPVADISSPVTGSISGAFFGPRAGELGGTYILPNLPDASGAVSRTDGAFTMVQSIP